MGEGRGGRGEGGGAGDGGMEWGGGGWKKGWGGEEGERRAKTVLFGRSKHPQPGTKKATASIFLPTCSPFLYNFDNNFFSFIDSLGLFLWTT
jgi:hypothetical protein